MENAGYVDEIFVLPLWITITYLVVYATFFVGTVIVSKVRSTIGRRHPDWRRLMFYAQFLDTGNAMRWTDTDLSTLRMVEKEEEGEGRYER